MQQRKHSILSGLRMVKAGKFDDAFARPHREEERDGQFAVVARPPEGGAQRKA